MSENISETGNQRIILMPDGPRSCVVGFWWNLTTTSIICAKILEDWMPKTTTTGEESTTETDEHGALKDSRNRVLVERKSLVAVESESSINNKEQGLKVDRVDRAVAVVGTSFESRVLQILEARV